MKRNGGAAEKEKIGEEMKQRDYVGQKRSYAAINFSLVYVFRR